MSARGQIAAAACLFILFAAYGMQALTIPLFPGQELEPFKPRTMPVALALAGLVLCAIRILQLARTPEPGVDGFARLDWWPAISLCVAMLGYGLLMIPLGFSLATTLFLLCGFLILGERRRRVLLIVPLTFSLLFYLLMTRGLGLYLAPGSWLGI